MNSDSVEVGMRVKVTKSNASGHSYRIGSFYFIKERYTGTSATESFYLSETPNGHRGSWLIYATEFELAFDDRAEEAAYTKKLAARYEALAKEYTVKAERLAKFKDDEEELAHTFSEAIKTGGDIDALYKLIKDLKLKRG